MTVAAITSDTAGRTLDLEVLQSASVAPASVFPLDLTISGSNTTRRITGLQKLVQRYALLFLSFDGSIKYAQGQGTGFMRAVLNGYVQSGEHVTHQFLFANADVLDQLRLDDSSPKFGKLPPSDETIAAATLLDYTVDRENARLFLQIRITNRDGDSTVFVLPTK